ncbi:N-6 DNA methylase [Bifidobacterium longum]|jgi:type I restriction-modification system DNA methylase subunit|uniref:site-specific DNA-methyltransferase (adenine-specific) n=1 Tax=Bifidobacterium longum subsp. infantis TaxID=1682 RepID=A0A564VUJ7_BIFLI|nr:N-6 DNA methylase [Bifidobacterium longum]MDB6741389.1 N-6 DNA methylase [Bifidobacterium longum]MDB6744401.1 N-6 DNA methylase [Bifidobacterium longum]MDB6746339.1 N-6 DNA methylase [Bifidobacterium longum]MDB6747275.1 N-6 DNA methylase [Bifidobacterium longum]MDB6749224.1 N-6 DNA methylase [Bifidobacterium longum]
MVVRLTEDKVRTEADAVLGLSALDGKDGARSGTGQITTFNQLGFQGVQDKPDGWYLPSNRNDVALVLEAKASTIPLGRPQAEELLKNIRIVNEQYHKTVGLLYNGDDLRVFKNLEEVEAPAALQAVGYYLGLFNENGIDKDHIYELTARINNCLHFEFGIKNLYHRMIFTACALVAKRYDAHFVADGKVDYSEFHQVILSTINKEMLRDKRQNFKLNLLGDVFAEIKMNLNVNSEDEKEQAHVRELIKQFIEWVTEISDCINSDAWRGEDVMGIFFNEFNRYKTKSEAGQVFTPEHITDFMYRILEVNKDDRILDATCGSGGFLVKAMANMIREAGGVRTEKAREIKDGQLFGIEYDREIYALACANMLIHKDGKTNLEQMDTREETACAWIRRIAGGVWEKDEAGRYVYRSGGVTKVMMNPPYENKYGCMTIVENVMDNVPPNTLCGFILPDKKLEKTGKAQKQRILKHHRLLKVIKLPEDLFFGIGVTTSIFVFKAGVPQNDEEFFTCWMKDDGLVTVKNKGRHDVYGRWPEIEDTWVNTVKKQSGDSTCKWESPKKHLSYQMPVKPFEITEEDFRRTAMDYLMFQQGIDAKEFDESVLAGVYAGEVSDDGENVTISIPKDDKR